MTENQQSTSGRLQSSDLRFGLLSLVTVILLAWQYWGMSIDMQVLPNPGQYPEPFIHSDQVNGGNSRSQLVVKDDQLELDCNIVLSSTFAFCGFFAPLVADGALGIDLSTFSEMHISLNYVADERDTLLVYLNNRETAGGSSTVEKNNLWAVSIEPGYNQFTIRPERFFIPSWWIFHNRDAVSNLDPDISNVVSVGLTTGDNTNARDLRFEVSEIRFTGKWISSEQLYFGLLIAWLVLLSYHGLFFVRRLLVNIEASRRQNQDLLNLNRYLDIQKSQFENMAKTDELTGVLNRNGVYEVIKTMLSGSAAAHRPISVVMFDIDHFKQINDEFGHKAGDEVLMGVAHLVRSNTRDADYLARWGGEEFILICPETGLRAARTMAETLRRIIGDAAFFEDRSLTCSFGVAELRANDFEGALKAADKALYEAKGAGRNQVMPQM